VSDADLRELERQGLSRLSELLAASCARAPDPDASARRTRELLAAACATDAPRLVALWRRDRDELLARLAAVTGVAPFLVRFLARHVPPLFSLLEGDLGAPRTLADYQTRLDRELASTAAGSEGDALRRFKYAELARITVRDAREDLVPEARVAETLSELSSLADALLDRALRCAATRLPDARGGEGSAAIRFCVLGLGKLGSEELNFSSDVDLIYVFESDADARAAASGGASAEAISPEEITTRLAREFGRLVGDITAEGFLYRIDLDLRPEGAHGPLVVSSAALANYYDARAVTVEKAAFMKARPVAGDLDFGWRVIRSLDAMIYRSAMDFGAVDGIRQMKERIEREKGREGDGFDVKIGAGGIRDVEFIGQALQLLHGGRIPQLRGRSTQGALRALADAGVLERAQAEALLEAYRFLRRVENRLQMEEERQTHRLPRDDAARRRLARSLGFDGPDERGAFAQKLDSVRSRIGETFARLFPTDESERVLALFARGARQLLAIPSTRGMVEDLAKRFAREIETSADPEMAANNLDRFIEGVGSRSFYYGLLLDRPELVPRLAALFGASKYLSALFASHPDLIEPVFRDPNVLLLSRPELERDLDEIRSRAPRRAGDEALEIELSALRLFHHRQLVNVALLDLAEKISSAESQRALGEIAEVCLGRALVVAGDELRRGRTALPAAAQAGRFLVVGMGKLGSHELGYGSDLDVIFLYDAASGDTAAAEAQEFFIRLAQKLVFLLDARTAEGRCYAVDAALRPSGNQGLLVTSLASLARYHAESAQAWERQALLRARPVAGSAELGAALRKSPPSELGAEIHRLRQRRERELARERPGHRDLKTGRGGLVDVEDVVQFLQLTHGFVFPQLLDVESIETLLERIEKLGLLTPDHARTLREGWRFLQRLASRLRIVENRSISELDERRAELEPVARALHYESSPQAGGARRQLFEDYHRHTEAIRAVYLEVLGVAS
jgi:glutamate-ammonia-ligase adenylyltransferase